MSTESQIQGVYARLERMFRMVRASTFNMMLMKVDAIEAKYIASEGEMPSFRKLKEILTGMLVEEEGYTYRDLREEIHAVIYDETQKTIFLQLIALMQT